MSYKHLKISHLLALKINGYCAIICLCLSVVINTLLFFQAQAQCSSTFTASPTQLCQNQNSQVALSSAPIPGATYSWNFGSGSTPVSSSTTGPHIVTWNSSGVKTITLTVTNGSCTSTSTVTVDINGGSGAPAYLTNTPPTTGCVNTPITVQVAEGPASTVYSWSCDGCAPQPPSTTYGPVSISWSSPGTKTIAVTTSKPGCNINLTTTHVITIYAPMTATIISPANSVTCINQNVTFQANAGGGTNYSWNCGGCSPPLGNTSGPFTASWTTTGVKTVSLTINVPGCPPSSTQTVITLNTPPTVSLTGPNIACTDLPISVNSSGTGSSYTWNCAGCASSPPLGSTVGAFNLSWSSPGTKTITLSANQAGCLPVVATHVVTVYSGAPVSIIQPTNNANSCVNQNLSLQASTGAATYTWSCDGCSPLPGSTSGPFNVSWSSAGTKTITVTASSPACNTSTASVEVVVNPPPAASISSPTPIITCIHTDITFEGTATGSSFNWNCAGCSPTPPASTGPFTASWSNAGTKTITLTANNIGCATPAIATVIVTVLSPVSAVIISPSSPTACVNQNVTLQAQAGGTSYGWNCDGCFPAPSSTAGPHTVQWSGAGVKTINLTVTTQSCPSTTTSMLITVNASPVANIISPGASTICVGNTVSLEASPGATTYSWNCSGCSPTPSNTAGPYTVSWQSAGVKTISLQAINPGCAPVSANQVLVTVNANIQAQILSPGNTAVCLTNSANLNATPGATSYSWTCGDCFPPPGNTSGPIT